MSTLHQISRPLLLGSILALGFLGACGDDDGEHDLDEAHLMFLEAPSATLAVGVEEPVTWQVHTEGELHHTEIRACMGHSDECGLGDASTFDGNFFGTLSEETYSANVNITAAGPWTIVVYAHVGETPHISEAVHVTVE